jgi:hypothetical protein
MACAPLAGNPAVTASFASVSTPVNGTFTILSFPQTLIRSAGGITFYSYTSVVAESGDIVGTSNVIGKLTIRADGSGHFNETETFAGSVLGRIGTFVESNTGTINSDGTFQGRGVIATGTAGLAGIHGRRTFQATNPSNPAIATYAGEVHIDPAT